MFCFIFPLFKPLSFFPTCLKQIQAFLPQNFLILSEVKAKLGTSSSRVYPQHSRGWVSQETLDPSRQMCCRRFGGFLWSNNGYMDMFNGLAGKNKCTNQDLNASHFFSRKYLLKWSWMIQRVWMNVLNMTCSLVKVTTLFAKDILFRLSRTNKRLILTPCALYQIHYISLWLRQGVLDLKESLEAISKIGYPFSQESKRCSTALVHQTMVRVNQEIVSDIVSIWWLGRLIEIWYAKPLSGLDLNLSLTCFPMTSIFQNSPTCFFFSPRHLFCMSYFVVDWGFPGGPGATRRAGAGKAALPRAQQLAQRSARVKGGQPTRTCGGYKSWGHL